MTDRKSNRRPRWFHWESIEHFKFNYPSWDSFPGVYVLQNERGHTIYVGQGANVKSRIQTHALRFDFVGIKVRPERDKYRRMWFERRLLYRLRPRKNGVCPTELVHKFGCYKYAMGRGR